MNPNVSLRAVLFGLFSFCSSILFAQTTYYVDAIRGNNGYSGRGGWKDAKKDLQEAINTANDGDKIWIASGTYYPTLIPDSSDNVQKGLSARDRSFYITKYLEIFGGFSGNETELSQRNWENNSTILSGDIGVADFQDDNCYHVVIISGVRKARLDGLIVSNGYADGDSPTPLRVKTTYSGKVSSNDIYDDKGGGIYIVNSPTQLENFWVKNNFSDDRGGGMFVTQSVSTLKNVTITNNESEDAEGGGAYFERTKNTLDQCVVANNKAYNGGGIFTLTDTLLIYNSLLYNNTAAMSGAGIYAGVKSVVNIDGSSIVGNFMSGGTGAGFYATQSNVKIKNTILQLNTINGSTSVKGADLDTSFLQGVLDISYSFTQNSWPGTENSVENVAFKNPLNAIGNDNTWKTGDDGFIPQTGAAVVKKGIYSSNVKEDITGLLRNDPMDIGAYQINECTAYNRILYVNGANTNTEQDGSSWERAFNKLQDALDIINAGCGSRVKEIWVAEGTYVPGKSPLPNDNLIGNRTFFLLKDVRLMGGFKGNESNEGGRNPSVNKTILSGQINDSSNTHHVLVISNVGVNGFISGFHIQNGHGNPDNVIQLPNGRTITQTNGGGMLCDSSFAYFSEMYFSNNKAVNGAGMYIYEGKPSFKSIFINNNQASSDGGGILLMKTNAIFENCILENNSAGLGGGIASVSTTYFFFNKVIVRNNKAFKNGGGYYGYAGTGYMNNSLFFKNDAGNGGGVFNEAQTLNSENLLFIENTAFSGGATYELNSYARYNNCNFVRNSAQTKAGATYGERFGDVHFISSIFADNTLAGVTNAAASDIFLENNVTRTFNNNLTQTAKPGTANKTGNPSFFNINDYVGGDGQWFTEDDGLMLLANSPCVGAGSLDIIPGLDITGRPLRGIVDMGAYMSYCSLGNDTILYVDAANNNSIKDGRSWNTAYNDLQKALNITLFNCSQIKEIWIKEGTYYPTVIPDSLYNEEKGIAMTPRFKTFFFKNDMRIYGGFAGTETHISERNITAHPTILSGDIGVAGDSSDNVYHILTLKKQVRGYTILDGFIFEGGNANANGNRYFFDTILSIPDSSGGAICAEFSGFTLKNSVFRNNYARSGAAIFSTQNTLELDNVHFENNAAISGGAITMINDNVYELRNLTFVNNRAVYGGAIFASGGAYILNNVAMENNTATYGGATFNNMTYPITLNNVIFKSNKALSGGAIHNYFSRTEISNGLFVENEATDTAGAIYSQETNLGLKNVSFSGNTAQNAVGAVFQKESAYDYNLRAYNSIFYKNAVNGNENASDADVKTQAGKFYATHTLSNTFTCDTCFTGDPLFVNPLQAKGEDGMFFTPDDGFSLQNASPVSNKAQWSATPLKDMCGYAKDIHYPPLGPYKISPCFTHHYTERLYVNVNQENDVQDGKSWETAYKDLQPALDVANAACSKINEIWVAKGIYMPAHFPDSLFNALKNNIKSDAQKAFYLSQPIQIYGGFEGQETALEQRNIEQNPTEFWGLYNGSEDTSSKCANIFLISRANNVLIDGVKFRYSNSTFTKINFNNIQFDNTYGGAVNASGSNIVLQNSIIQGASAINGGGAFYSDSSTVKFYKNLLENNRANMRGGAVSVFNSSFVSESNIYKGNAVWATSVDGEGGAVNLNNSTINSYNDIWEDNLSYSGGALNANRGSRGMVRKSVFFNNKALTNGGAFRQFIRSSVQFENVLFANNTALKGGAVHADDTLSAGNCTFLFNEANSDGAAIFISETGQNRLNLINSLFDFNVSTGTAKDFSRQSNNSYTVQYNILQESYSGTGNITGLSTFKNINNLQGADETWMTEDDGAVPNISSIAINNGSNAGPEKDITGYSRQGSADIGAYEFTLCNSYENISRIYVDVNNTSTFQDGLSWNTAYTKLQDALSLAGLSCIKAREIWVAQGIYHPDYIPDIDKNTSAGNDLSERRKSFWNTVGGLHIIGGFTAGDTAVVQRNPLQRSIIDGEIGVANNIGDNSIHLWVIANVQDTTGIDGFEFRNANANTNKSFWVNGNNIPDFGAAILLLNSNLKLTNSSFSNNYAITSGAVHLAKSILKAEGVNFDNNSAEDGGAIGITNSLANIQNAGFNNNYAVQTGGAIRNTNNSTLTISNSNFNGNKANDGGGIENTDKAKLDLINCAFLSDSARNGASINLEQGTELVARGLNLLNSKNNNGTIRANTAKIRLVASMFSGNTSFENGAALNIFGAGQTQVDSCTFEGNSTAGQGGAVFLDNADQNCFITHSVFKENSAKGNGGALKIGHIGPSFKLTDNTFEKNTSECFGGAFAAEYSWLNTHRCNYIENTAVAGGAIYFTAANNAAQLDTSYFIGNIAGAGGAIYNDNNIYRVLLHRNVFEENSATKGGAYYGYGKADLNMLNNIFYRNNAGENGGALYNRYQQQLSAMNSLFIENTAKNGAAFYGEKGTSQHLINNHFYKNNALESAAVFYEADVKGEVFNNIFRLNNINGNENVPDRNIRYQNLAFGLYANMLDSALVGNSSSNYLETDPYFANEDNYRGEDNIWFTLDDGLIPEAGSPVRGKGVKGIAYEYDILNRSRNNIWDLGAYRVDELMSSINNLSLLKVSVFPNPFEQAIQIRFEEVSGALVQIEVIDLIGRTCYARTAAVVGNTLQISLPDTLQSGLYILRIQDQYKFASMPLVKGR